MKTPAGYGDYSNPATAGAQRQTDRSFDQDESRVNQKLAWANKMANPSSGSCESCGESSTTESLSGRPSCQGCAEAEVHADRNAR
jgi:RNA polymerase-binding transcription factor DksA